MKKLIIFTLLLLLQTTVSFGYYGDEDQMKTGIQWGTSWGESLKLANLAVVFKENEKVPNNFLTIEISPSFITSGTRLSVFTEMLWFNREVTGPANYIYVYKDGTTYRPSSTGELPVLFKLGLEGETIESDSQINVLLGVSWLSLKQGGFIIETLSLDYHLSLGGKSYFELDFFNFGFYL